jgi:cyclohexanecarboxylate-CoA ligase
VRIVGRSKDIIIRGGENVPVVEIEGLLYRHPAVQDAAIVAMPHERLGEQGCAFVTPKPGQTLSLDDMRAWLERHGVAKNYWPERLEAVEAMPRTPSGKIQKFKLRETARALGSA